MPPDKPVSEKQLEANRRNAQLSTGPRTAEGKRTSRANALRHNLTGQLTLMGPEERAVHDAFFSRYVEWLKPEGPVEQDLAEAIAENSWRLKRARALDHNMFAAARPEFSADAGNQSEPTEDNADTDVAVAEARAFLADGKQFQILTLYEQRIQRSMEKSAEQLRALQAERLKVREEALAQAKNLAQHSYAFNKPYNPALDFPPENGFVFSTAEINAAILRDRRFKEARSSSYSGFDSDREPDSDWPQVIDWPKAA